MGSLGDGITSGVAGPTMIRTAPLWGVRAKSVYLHDGRAGDPSTAISLHDGQGKAAATAFGALSTKQQQDLINFLITIEDTASNRGRAGFFRPAATQLPLTRNYL